MTRVRNEKYVSFSEENTGFLEWNHLFLYIYITVIYHRALEAGLICEEFNKMRKWKFMKLNCIPWFMGEYFMCHKIEMQHIKYLCNHRK